jgi:hypothetical protein
MSNSCIPFTWAPSTVDSLGPTLIVCSISLSTQAMFWLQLLIFSSLRQRNMIWLYVYLITDFLLISRFLTLYGIRQAALCLFTMARDFLCYLEASSKFYINTVQSYLVLAFNLCRYAQIVHNRNIYADKLHWIGVGLLIICLLPAVNVIVQFVTSFAQLWRRRGGSCDIQYLTVAAQIFNLFVTYAISVTINLIFLILDIRHVSSVHGIVSRQIIDLRRRRQRILLLQTVAFYSIWLLLWSPDIVAFQFINVNSEPAIFTSLLNYIGIVIDPLLLMILDLRLITPWRTVWHKIRARARVANVGTRLIRRTSTRY